MKSALFAKGERIIPTRMGTRINYIKSSRYRKDHPHAYGDKYFCQVRHRHVVGSSPRVWGQELFALYNIALIRIIPTRMGTSIVLSKSFKRTKDHPHAYGDKTAGLWGTHSHLGSSPRVWGQGLFFSALEL